MAGQWLYRHDDRVYGPVTLRELEAAMLLGFIRPDDLVSRHERHCWKRLVEYPELQSIGVASDGQPPGVYLDGVRVNNKDSSVVNGSDNE